jgi:magnesium transporter
MNEELKDSVRSVLSERPNYAASIEDMSADEIARLLESVPIEDRLILWSKIEISERLAILICLRHDPRDSIIDEMSFDDLDLLFDDISADQLIELAETLPDRLVQRALRLMDDQQIEYFKQAQEFSDEKIGHWVNQNLLMLSDSSKVRDSLRLVRREVPSYTNAIFLINNSGEYQGAIPIHKLIGIPESTKLSELLFDEFPTLNADDGIIESSRKTLNSGHASLPVVDALGKLVGRLDVGTAGEMVEKDYESKIMANAGLDEQEDLFSPVSKSIKGRSTWLGINLLTALLASWFIGLFQATLETVVALAVLMPVVASMGGIAGSQTLALIIRGLALGQVNESNSKVLLHKEIKIGAVSGCIWSIMIAIVASLWFENIMIGVVIAVAILVNIIMAAIAGIIVPITLKKLKFDPALSGAVILTTITDIVGFVVFLGLGSLLLTA